MDFRQAVVNVILQTRNGFLWVGTGAALDRFDGRHFTTIEFSPQMQTEGLSQCFGRRARWRSVGGHKLTGVLRIPRAALDQFGRLPAKVYHAGAGPADSITALQFSGDGVLWAGTDRGLYRLERGAFSTVLPDVSVSRIEKASNGRLLIVTSRRVLRVGRRADGRAQGYCRPVRRIRESDLSRYGGPHRRALVLHRCGCCPRGQWLDRTVPALRYSCRAQRIPGL